MSNYWDLYCVDCKVKAVAFGWNHGEPELAKLIPLLPHFAALTEALRDVSAKWADAEWSSISGLTRFARDHAGHTVKPVDEYGYTSDRCRGQYRCSECGYCCPCALSDGHDGEHRRIAP